MAARPAVHGRATGLAGRRRECDVLDRLVEAVRAGESRALVLAGEPGAGKTALLGYLAGRAAGLPELVIAGLPEADARALLDSVTAGPLDERVRDRIVAETRGNPLALAEQGRMVRPAQLAGGFGLPGAAPVAAVDESIRRRVEALPAQTRRLLLVAAADPTRDPKLVWRGAPAPWGRCP